MKEKIIEFKAQYGNAYLSGYAIAEELDDEDHGINFYDEKGFTTPSFPLKWDAEGDEGKLRDAFTTDAMLPKILDDFQDEEISLDRGDYILHINGGTPELKHCLLVKNSIDDHYRVVDNEGFIYGESDSIIKAVRTAINKYGCCTNDIQVCGGALYDKAEVYKDLIEEAKASASSIERDILLSLWRR